MRKGRKRRQEVDEELLQAIFRVGEEWKQIKSIVDKSIEPTFDGENRVAISQAKYVYLLQEAKYRQISAMQYN
ncbi:YaaL family protein [Virgibacillus soli]|uniref:YaaL family protein n=1 Tax=Paracerasibacillus soli TaxID=480284 RepID=UPI0035F0009D